jgi:hypothetical protein
VEYGPYFTADVKGLYDWISDPANLAALHLMGSPRSRPARARLTLRHRESRE